MHEIDVASIEMGIALSRWFDLEAKRVYAMLNETENEESLRIHVEWIRLTAAK